MLRLAALLVPVAGLALAAPPGANPSLRAFPPPKTLGPVETYGANIQRAMTLMATSTPLKRNTVRILFYGQSITADEWTHTVAETLRRRYPLTDFVIENRAIGGFPVHLLARTAEADLYPFYPDLVIFHAYGSPERYEDILRRIRERTTADILHATDHFTVQLHDDLAEETDPAKLRRPDLSPAAWQQPNPARQAWMNHVFLPALSKKYGTELADVRGLWKHYLVDHRLRVADLLKKEQHLIHPNEHGNYLMSQIILPYLRHRPDLPDDGWTDRVKTYAVGPGADVDWKDGKLVLPFDGNRVDLVCRAGSGPPAGVRIDGKKPSEFPGMYALTRTALDPPSYGPPILSVGHTAPLVAEEWTLAVTAMNPERTWFKFKVRGSVTGDDGEGDTAKRFVSRSGRVVFEPEDYALPFCLQMSRNPRATAPVVRWRVVPLFADEFVAPATPNPFGDTVVTVAQGLPNGRHTLEITGTPDTPVAAVRVYRPPLSGR